MQEIIWTALPNGGVPSSDRASFKLNLTVHVSPRLQDNGVQLGSFVDFVDWPRTLGHISFVVHIGEQKFFEDDKVTRVRAARSELWAALFKKDTFVRSHVPDDYSKRVIHSYPVMNVMAFIKEQYTIIAISSAVNLPTIDRLNDPFAPIAPLDSERGARIREHQKRLQELDPHAMPPAPAAPADDFFQVGLFHASTEPIDKHEKVILPEIDFHQIVSLLGNYPEVLRLLGLAIDFTIDVPPDALSADDVFVEPLWTPSDPASNVTPLTILDPNARFRPRPRDPNTLIHRHLRLRSENFGVVQVDVDGAAIKAMNFAGQLAKAAQLKTEDTPTVASVPSIRSGGLSIVRTGRAEAVAKNFQHIAKLNQQTSSNSVKLLAEDIQRGYRVDVREVENGTPREWFSLCLRNEVHEFTDIQKTVSFADVEGVASLAVTQKPKTLGDDFVLHESLFRWAGWSLSVPPPLESVQADETEVQTEGSKPALGLKSTFEVADVSRPKLRFGRVYQFRVRTVDLAGNSPRRFEGTDDATVTNPEDGFYARFEPVSAPVIVPRDDPRLSPGESVERLVVRSNAGQSPEEYLERLPAFELLSNEKCSAFPRFRAADYHAATERHIAPPKIGLDTAETHGMLDSMSDADIADAKTRTDNVPKIAPDEVLDLHYLPDPLAFEACLVNLPGAGMPLIHPIPFTEPGDRWPKVRGFRLRLVGIKQDAAPAAPDFDPDTRVLKVELPQAEIVRFRISSMLQQDANLQLMGIWRWIEEGIKKLPGSDQDRKDKAKELRALALHGLHWMLTPFREMVLVHAVQQPLLKPEFVALIPEKSQGQTFAQFEGVIRCDGKSTGKLDVIADWDEPVDDPGETAGPHCEGGPQPPISHKAHAFAFPINFKDPIKPGRPIVLTDGVNPIASYDHDQRLLTFSNDIARGNAPRHDFGDTKHRLIHYSAVGTTRFREYFHCVITEGDEKNITRKSKPLPLHIISSARPDAPKVLYVVPTFGWKRTDLRGVVESKRRGGGLRVYLDRPWFSSGEGEMLGVILWTGELPTDNDQLNRLKPYITRWGLDPIWSQKPLAANLEPQNFTLAKVLDPNESKTTGLNLDELGFESNFSVAPHDVAYDEVRRLWYSEIEIDPGPAYIPFLRLALARYQPHSVDDVYLSRVVLADFAQLAPDRSASVAFGESGHIKITVSGNAFAESRDAGENRVTATVQEHTGVDAVLGWTTVSDLSVELHRQTAEFVELNSWSGELTLPQARQSGSMRLLIEEWERYVSDGTGRAGGDSFRERLVYAEALEL